MQKIVTHLWFDDQAEAAARFYVSIFKQSRLGEIAYYTDSMVEVAGRPKGSVMTVTFELNGQQFIALNGGPMFKFSEAISLVNCESQSEVDELWNKLTADGGSEQPCGWLKDKYGLSWQIVPVALEKLLHSGQPKKIDKMLQAMLTMKKLDAGKLQEAYERG